MLKPRRAKSPAIRLSAPDSSSTTTERVCFIAAGRPLPVWSSQVTVQPGQQHSQEAIRRFVMGAVATAPMTKRLIASWLCCCPGWTVTWEDQTGRGRPAAMKHTLSVVVEDESGALSRIAGLFARRGFNIDSLAVGRQPGCQC